MKIKRGQREFWQGLKVALRSFAKIYTIRIGVNLGCDEEDLAQAAVEKVIGHLDAVYGEGWRAEYIPQHIANHAIAYAKTCLKNEVRSRLKAIKNHERIMRLSPHLIHADDGVLEISGRRAFNPEQQTIARDFIRVVSGLVARKRSAQMTFALETIMEEAGNDVQGQDLTHLAGVSSNVLSFERRRLRKKLKTLGYNDWELGDEEKV